VPYEIWSKSNSVFLYLCAGTPVFCSLLPRVDDRVHYDYKLAVAAFSSTHDRHGGEGMHEAKAR